jgi:DNA-binding response OmpR family regulator
VAIFNASDDTVEMLEQTFQHAGFRTADAHVSDIKRGEQNFGSFIEEHDPQAIIWDISPPYAQNWNFFQLMRTSALLNGRGIVLTTTNVGHLNAIAGRDTGAIEIVGKPYDLDLIVSAVKRTLGQA